MDMLKGSIADKLLLFTLPLAAGSILQQLFNAADIAVVGRFVGNSAMAAVGSNAPVVELMVNLFVGISLGANVAIAQAIGRNDREEVTEAVHTSILVAVLGGLLVGAAGQAVVGAVIDLLSVPEDVRGLSALYMRIYLTGLPAVFLYNFEASIFRSRGDTGTPLAVLTISGIMNVILNVLFVAGLGMSVGGVALATVLSNLFSAGVLLLLLVRSKDIIRVELRYLRIHPGILGRILGIGLPTGVQGMLFSVANLCIQWAINLLGTTVMAGCSAAYNVEVVTYYLIASFGQACATFTGQNYGASNFERCRKILKSTLLIGGLLMVISGGIVQICGRPLLRLFSTDPAVIDAGYIRLTYINSMYIFTLLMEVMAGYMRGFGISVLPAAACLTGVCGVRVLWTLVVFTRFPSIHTVMAAYPISMFLTALPLWVIYLLRRNRAPFAA